VKLTGKSFDNALVNIDDFCVLTWWLMCDVHQPLEKKGWFSELSREGAECEGVNEWV